MDKRDQEIEEAFRLLERLVACVHDAQAREGIDPKLLLNLNRVQQESKATIEWLKGQDELPSWAVDGLMEEMRRYIDNYRLSPHRDLSDLSMSQFKSRIEQRRYATGIFVNDITSFKDREAIEKVLAGEWVDKSRLQKRASANAFDLAFSAVRWEDPRKDLCFEKLYLENRNLDDFWNYRDNTDGVLEKGLFHILEQMQIKFRYCLKNISYEDMVRVLLPEAQRRLSYSKDVLRNVYELRKRKTDKLIPELDSNTTIYVNGVPLPKKVEGHDINFETMPTYEKKDKKKVITDYGKLSERICTAMADIRLYSNLIRDIRICYEQIRQNDKTTIKDNVGVTDWTLVHKSSSNEIA